jgi:hypothetical protein
MQYTAEPPLSSGVEAAIGPQPLSLPQEAVGPHLIDSPGFSGIWIRRNETEI